MANSVPGRAWAQCLPIPRMATTSLPSAPSQTGVSQQVDDVPRPVDKLPHERDESTDSQHSEPRPEMAQAYEDLKQGRVDTDRGPPMDQTYERTLRNQGKTPRSKGKASR